MAWYDIFGGSIAKSVENIAKEFIETDMEAAEAKALMVKTLDPNGLMRRDISTKVSNLYAFYVIITTVLIVMSAFGLAEDNARDAIAALTSLFIPITSLFGIIVSASFGVNYANTLKGN
ncbi:MAG: hypothetical protein Q9M40_07110 [Sulfurimonas sp.]|nr:hypothetical protein [Sulfurimonas sp.]MDQ7067743.1 hypothetical protein [Sulfurimonas sp.]